MIRPIYHFLLRLHPPHFRERFEEEMLDVFDNAVAAYGPASLLADGMVSLARQWILRPHQPVNPLRLTSSRTPCFYLIEHETLRPSAQIAGTFSALLLLATVQFTVSHWSRPIQSIAGLLKTGGNVPSLLQIQVPTTAHADKRSVFEVASIRPTSPNHRDGKMTVGMAPAASGPGRIRYPIINSRWLVSTAYGLPAAQVDGPDWMNSEYFDVNATFPINTPPDQIQLMLQNLLAERFGLKVHRDTRTRQAAAFSLVMAKGGHKMKLWQKPNVPFDENARVPPPSGPLQKDSDGFFIMPPPPPGAKYVEYAENVNGLSILLNGYRQTMPELAASLSSRLKGVVTNATDLAGEYDYKLRYSKEDIPPADGLPDIFSAVQMQLGLKLERTGTVPVNTIFIVVDHMEKRPTEN